MTPDRPRHPALVLAWKIASISIGSTLILLGLVMLFTPGPGWLAIFAGLAMLSPHSAWAKAILHWLRQKLRIHHVEPAARGEAAAPAEDGAARDDRRARM